MAGEGSNEQIAKVIVDHGRKSEVWNGYNMVILTNGKKKAQCKECQALLTAEGNSTLRRHTEKTCPRLKARDDPNQPIINNQGQIWLWDAELSRQMTTKCVIQVGLPFGHFANPHITKLIKETLQPRYEEVSRQTLRRDALKMWKTARLEMSQMFSSMPNNVSLTCDVWSAPYGLPQSYICITAHWIEPQSWQLVKRVITFEPFGAPHSGERQFKIIKKSLGFYKIDSKIISISFDNASNNNLCVNKLKCALTPILDGKIFHTRCCAHIINLAVQDGLTKCKPVLDKFRIMLRRIFTKGKKMHAAFRTYCQDCGFRALGPNHDMPVRWNSTYFMIENLVRQKQYIHAFYQAHYPRNSIGVFDWNVIEGLHDILGDFKNATTLLSGIYYPTSPLLLNQLFILANKISQYEDHTDWGSMVSVMKQKLLKYFLKIPFGFLVAATLNPYLNATGVEILITQISEAFGLDTALDNSFSVERIRVYNRDLKDLFDHYKLFYGGGSAQSSSRLFSGSGSSSSSGAHRQNRQEVMTNLMNQVLNESSKKSRFDTDLGELNIYLHTNFMAECPTNDIDAFEKIDLLEFWKQKESQFPVLACMARDILTIQASTVASESAFSLSGRIISARRTRLTPESVECCICLKDYLDSIDRIQHTTSLEMEIEVVEANLEENEMDMGLSTPPTTDTDGTSNVSHYDDDEELDIDDLDDQEAIRRIQTVGTLQINPTWETDEFWN